MEGCKNANHELDLLTLWKEIFQGVSDIARLQKSLGFN